MNISEIITEINQYKPKLPSHWVLGKYEQIFKFVLLWNSGKLPSISVTAMCCYTVQNKHGMVWFRR